MRYALKLCHPSQFSDEVALKELRAFLAQQDQGFVLTDVAGRRDLLHMAPTHSEVFIRWTGNSLHPTDYQRLDGWAQRLKVWLSLCLKTVYFFIHQPGKMLCPETCSYLTQRLNEKAGLGLRDAVSNNLFPKA